MACQFSGQDRTDINQRLCIGPQRADMTVWQKSFIGKEQIRRPRMRRGRSIVTVGSGERALFFANGDIIIK